MTLLIVVAVACKGNQLFTKGPEVKHAADWMFLNVENGLRKLNKVQRAKHIDADGKLKNTWFWRSFIHHSGTYSHGRIGEQKIRSVFKYWNARLGLNLEEAFLRTVN